jgi:hypothetical protein
MRPTSPITYSVECSHTPAQLETGGPFVGVEMHNSSPLLNRVSFFYPVANSIDLSTSYWQRGQSRVLSLGLKVGHKPKEWIGLEPFDYQLTPYSVTLSKRHRDTTIRVTYQFCLSRPAMVATVEITNSLVHSELFEVYTHLEVTLRTSHTYAVIDKAWTEFDETGSTIFVCFDDRATGAAQIFVANAGEQPTSFAANGEAIGLPGAGNSWWMDRSGHLPGEIVERAAPKRPAAAFLYRRKLDPGQRMVIAQIIGSCRRDEGREIVSYLLEHYEQEVNLYEESVLDKAYRNGPLETGDGSIDRSARWAKAVLAANAHYLDGQVVPMPCPAEYNYLFAHDVLMADLAAVHFDIARVKKDLQYLVAKADGTITHAYYWKDSSYVTEQATSDSWNHLWFILLSASYLRHSGDTATAERLYPYLLDSARLALKSKGDDELIWAHHPDWWDIGSSFGPRSYMTILTIRALRELAYVSSVLGKQVSELLRYERLASSMQEQMSEKLWDQGSNYLISYYEDGSTDRHIYVGSLLAAHFRLVELDERMALVETARSTLLDEQLGIRNVFPVDFHLLADYLNLRRNEVGEPGVYMNGGIWPHGNAWYALALISIGEMAEASRFIRRAMTLEGVSASPNGQPAMYEYRNSNRLDSSAYGRVDKPQFLWAAGWYLYAVYNLLGVRETAWNIAVEPYVLQGQAKSRYSLFVKGKLVEVTVSGQGRHVKSIQFDGTPCPTTVIPAGSSVAEEIKITLGTPEGPYITRTDSILTSCRFDAEERRLVAHLEAFPGHENETQVISPWQPSSASVNGVELGDGWRAQREGGVFRIRVGVRQRCTKDTLQLRF